MVVESRGDNSDLLQAGRCIQSAYSTNTRLESFSAPFDSAWLAQTLNFGSEPEA